MIPRRLKRLYHQATLRDPAFKFVGVGTQRVETIVQKFFPRAKVQRMDADTTGEKNAHWRILGDAIIAHRICSRY